MEPGREYQIRRLEPPDVQPLRRGVPDVDSDDEELSPGVSAGALAKGGCVELTQCVSERVRGKRVWGVCGHQMVLSSLLSPREWQELEFVFLPYPV